MHSTVNFGEGLAHGLASLCIMDFLRLFSECIDAARRFKEDARQWHAFLLAQ